jgi:hypothetical protein
VSTPLDTLPQLHPLLLQPSHTLPSQTYLLLYTFSSVPPAPRSEQSCGLPPA